MAMLFSSFLQGSWPGDDFPVQTVHLSHVPIYLHTWLVYTKLMSPHLKSTWGQWQTSSQPPCSKAWVKCSTTKILNYDWFSKRKPANPVAFVFSISFLLLSLHHLVLQIWRYVQSVQCQVVKLGFNVQSWHANKMLGTGKSRRRKWI
jgi:hypothetical protein